MNILKMAYIDVRRSKFQLLFIILFIIVAWALTTSNTSGIGGTSYLAFATVILSGQPFLLEQRQEAGFLYMLPATRSERIAGRYCFGMFLMLLTIIEILFLNVIERFAHGAFFEQTLFQTGLCFGFGLIVVSLQYILFYAMGKIKHQQLLGIITMAPGFLMLFLFSLAYDNANTIQPLLWILEHPEQFITLLIPTGILIWFLSMILCIGITKRKDFL